MTKFRTAMVGYQAAITLWSNLNRDHYSRFNAMLVANSITLTMIGLLLNNDKFAFLAIPFSLLGFALTYLWRAFMERDFNFAHFYATYARKWENKLPPIDTVYWGGILADGGFVTVHDGRDYSHYQMEARAKYRTKEIIIYIIDLFAVAYLLILLSAFWLLHRGIISMP